MWKFWAYVKSAEFFWVQNWCGRKCWQNCTVFKGWNCLSVDRIVLKIPLKCSYLQQANILQDISPYLCVTLSQDSMLQRINRTISHWLVSRFVSWLPVFLKNCITFWFLFLYDCEGKKCRRQFIKWKCSGPNGVIQIQKEDNAFDDFLKFA